MALWKVCAKEQIHKRGDERCVKKTRQKTKKVLMILNQRSRRIWAREGKGQKEDAELQKEKDKVIKLADELGEEAALAMLTQTVLEEELAKEEAESKGK